MPARTRRARANGSPRSTARRSRARSASCCRRAPRGASAAAAGARVRSSQPPSVGSRSPGALELNGEQQAALAPLTRGAWGPWPPRGALLHGVTGSGKTEVYLQAAAAALEQGRGAIVLVPEIALTPQIVARFIERFGETVAVLHSRLTAAERYAEWRRLREGDARVCVGPRSAVFAPIERPRADRRRRGARQLLQARIRPPLRRARRRRRACRAGGGAAAARQRDAAAGERSQA